MKKYIWIAIILNTLTGCGGNTTKSIHPIDRSQFFLKEYSGTYTNGNNEDFVISPNGEFEQYLNVPALKNEAVFTNTEFICTYKLKGKIQNISFIPKKTKDVNYSYEVSSLFNTFGENLDYVLKLSYENSDIVGLTKLSNPSETTIKPEIIKQQAADCLNGLKSRKTYRIEFSNYYSSGLSLKDYSSIENNTWAINIDKNSMRRIPPDVNSYYYSENSFKIESRNLLQDNYVKALSPSSEGPSEKPHQNFSNYPQLFISDIKGLSFQSNSSFRYDLSFDSSGNKMVLQYKLYNCVFNYTWSIQSIEAYPSPILNNVTLIKFEADADSQENSLSCNDSSNNERIKDLNKDKQFFVTLDYTGIGHSTCQITLYNKNYEKIFSADSTKATP